MLRTCRLWPIAAAFAVACAAAPASLWAGDAAQDPAPAAGAAEAAKPDDAGGCPNRMAGAPCCAECQEKKPQGAAAEPCPCQRARQAAKDAKDAHAEH